MPNEREPEKQTGNELKTVQEFQRAPIKLGCLGFTLTGWVAVMAALAVVLLLAYVVRRLWF